ncbi:phosphoribosylglycinamide formyltransferase [Candidatus Peregrinibacteria bacterium HGW-Peregrinibacteria-1]|jgi:phosphoribosylglycinamide formyltransferase-1|nr:MAG: phosphoribosylglycinamide formyltransferase [Candidatus Peregrinibacteria bacterium HGW-Peregrinibacteria-1]
MSKVFKIGVLASTNGTALQAIIDEILAGLMPGVALEVVASNLPRCGAILRAERCGFNTVVVSSKDKFPEEFDLELFSELRKFDLDLIVLVGYMRVLTPAFLNNFSGKVINVHPSLIPKYCGRSFYGASVHQAVLDSGDKVTGMTIHYVDEGVDTGEIIVQKKCKVLEDDTVESLKARVQELEKKWYPEVIRRLSREALR